jgi:hypothetical protein
LYPVDGKNISCGGKLVGFAGMITAIIFLRV